MPTQIIVLIVLFAIFALTTLLNRDTQPLPSRPVRGKGPGMPEPGGRPAGPGELNAGQVARRPEIGAGTGARGAPAGERPFTGRWTPPNNPPATRVGGPLSAALEDGIRILDDGRSGRGQNGVNPTGRKERAGLIRRGQRGRAPSSGALKSIEHERPRALSGLADQALAQKNAKPLTAAPLAFPMSPINGPLNQISPDSVVNTFGDEGRTPSMSEIQIRDLVASPKRLREMIIMNVILQPPLSMQLQERRGRRRI
jgi:hypothetical protein